MSRRIAAVSLILLALALAAPAGATLLAAPQPTTAPDSHRVIVALNEPSVAEWAAERAGGALEPTAKGRHLDLSDRATANYADHLVAAQRAFITTLRRAVPGADVATFIDENGHHRAATYQLVFNGMAVDAGQNADVAALEKSVAALPGVRRVYRDAAHQPDMYASLPLINAPAAWSAVGGQANAGRGVKVASVDGGLWVDAAMFNGKGFSYPPGYPIGFTSNTNGKIIVSRAYFRTWDPPSPGDEKPWPGTNGTGHGLHTGATAAGDPVVAPYLGITVTLSGVAPAAYAMSYRVFYNSITNNGSFYDAEGIAAIDDTVRDGAEVMNNSWGGGPSSTGGEYDALDTALINAWKAGEFVSMANGNSGPGAGTGDHSSDEYINAAASTTTGTYAAGRGIVTAPQPVSETLKGFGYLQAGFGAPFPVGETTPAYPFTSALAADPANYRGCDPWPAGTFTEKAAVISRGVCEFGVKALNAQNAGAVLVIIYNNPGQNVPFGMGPGAVGGQVTVPVVSVAYNIGLQLLDWVHLHGDAARLVFDTKAYQVGNVPDYIADFSSRGPGVGNVLKPDIAAPGVNILSQGFGAGGGAVSHLGFGQVSGTSMAAPHVAGAGAMMRQIHPDWSNTWIKSALMSTSKFCGIRNGDGSPAQPLDMGAGRLDLTRAATPGVILSPPSISFGQVVSGTMSSLTVMVRSVADTSQTYDLGTAMSDLQDCHTPVAGLSVQPATLTLAPGQESSITVHWDTAKAGGYADRQGYVVLSQAGTVMAHLPAWVRVGYPGPAPDVLVLDNDGSAAAGMKDYTSYYTSTLKALGVTYDVKTVDGGGVPNATELSRYGTVLYQTGDASVGPGPFGQEHLTEFVNNGGHLLAFGQDLAASWGSNNPAGGTFAYDFTLGGRFIQDSVSGGLVFTTTAQILSGLPETPLRGLRFDVSSEGNGAGNQESIDEIDRTRPDWERPAANFDDYRLLMRYSPAAEPLSAGAAPTNGYIGIGHRQNVTLEKPGMTFHGRTQYYSFGLEGINDNTGYNTRADLMSAALAWLHDTATATIAAVPAKANEVTQFTATVTSSRGRPGGETYRWDFGDEFPYTLPNPSAVAGHTYHAPGTYAVRVEVTDSLGTRTIAQSQVVITGDEPYYPNRRFVLYLPALKNGAQ